MLEWMAKSRERRQTTVRLLAVLVARARDPVFFTKLGVADTIDGRFDLVALHAFLVLERLEVLGRRDLSQSLTDALFAGFDEALRDQGAGDIGMGRRIKKMANAFYGRLNAYRIAADRETLAASLLRNVYREQAGREASAHTLAHYAEVARSVLASCDIEAGDIDFGPLPG